MSRTKDPKPGYGKLLDAWDPPDHAGEPVGCVATTFTFSPSFFEEECLGRFLQLQTNPDEDGPAHIVEREERLAQLVCAAAVVDQHHCRGTRSLRWDLLPVRLRQGVLHAKVVVLHWAQATRVVVASANLTEDGYRRNQEVFGVLDYFEGSDAPSAVLRDMVAFVGKAVDSDPGARGTPVHGRIGAFLERVRRTAGPWGVEEAGRRRHGQVRVEFLATVPGSPDGFAMLRAAWPGGAPPSSAWVLSPFHDAAAVNRPAESLWKLMRKRGRAEVTYCVEVEDIPGEHAVFANAPAGLLEATPERDSASSGMMRLNLPSNRPLHAKGIWLEDDNVVLYMIGSSNFTSPGMGIGSFRNIEANLAYIADRRAGDRCYTAMTNGWPDCVELDDSMEVRFRPASGKGIDSASGEVPLPEAFSAASYDNRAGGGVVQLHIKGKPPDRWVMCKDSESGEVVYSEGDWHGMGSPETVTIDWVETRAPSGFRVRWHGCEKAAWLPVNVVSGTSLPPPEELRNLPLETLIDILTSARPLHQALRHYLSRRERRSEGDGVQESVLIDPHRRVDTTGFLLQRTRRVSSALNGLRERLERPVVSRESLEWRLRGPVGALALRNALVREARSCDERLFLLSELALELCRCAPKPAKGAMQKDLVRAAIRKLAAEIMDDVRGQADKADRQMQAYMDLVCGIVAG